MVNVALQGPQERGIGLVAALRSSVAKGGDGAHVQVDGEGG
jgi:hypothetical protein